MALWTNVDNEAGKPKYLSDSLRNDQTVSDLDSTVGIDKVEKANVPSAQHAGWVLTTEGSGGRAGRTFSETLVAMGSMTGDNDTVAPEITISGQPSNSTIFSGSTATFSVTATKTGSGTLAYQWQIQQNGTGSWANVATGTGGTTNSYTTAAATVAAGAGASNTDKFRCVVSLTGAESVTSNAVTLTVNPSVITITDQPTAQTAVEGNTATFSVTATATGSATLSYQWQKQESGAGAWADVSGATSASYTTGALTVADDNTDNYRVVVSANKEATPVTSDAVALTVTL